MKRSRWTVFWAAALLLLWTVPAGAFEIGARAYYWFPGIEANMKSDGAGLPGTDINLKNQLNIDSQSFPAVEVFGGFGRSHIGITYTPVSYSGSTTLSAPITFNGQTFPALTGVRSDVDLRMVDLEYRYTVLDTENILAGFSIDLIGQIKYIDGEAKIASATLGREAKESFQLPLPMVGIGAHAGLLMNILEARAKATGIGYSGNYLYEALADLSWTPFPFLDIHAGYKVIRVKYDRSGFFLNADFAGPYLALTVSF